MSRKYEAIDLMKLYTHGSAKGWNDFLKRCLQKQNVNQLAKTRYQICAGMDDLAKLKLNDDAMNAWFARLTRSIEQTAKKIIHIRHPMPGDNALISTEFKTAEYLAAKRARDLAFRTFMRESGY